MLGMVVVIAKTMSQYSWRITNMTIEEKLALVSTEYKTASQIGLPAATLGALARRGLVEALDTVPKQYRKSQGNAARIYSLIEQNKDDYDTYFFITKSTEKYRMLCSFSKTKNAVLDCWGKPYDLANVTKIEFGKRSFDL